MSELYCFYCDTDKHESQFHHPPAGRALAGNRATIHTHPEGRLKCKACTKRKTTLQATIPTADGDTHIMYIGDTQLS
jgi:hypothetical protein